MAPVKKPKPILGPHYLKQWREFRGINQDDAAAAINLERGSLSKIENGHIPYQQQYVEGLARLYGCRPADLLGTDPLSTPADPNSALRSALLSYGVDRSQVEIATGLIETFVVKADEARQAQNKDRGSLQPANRPREEEPSR